MLDVIKAAFVLANNGWLGAVLLALLLTTLFVLAVLFKRQKRLLVKTKAILDKSAGFDRLSGEFKNFAEEIDQCFVKIHKVIDTTTDSNNHSNETRHDQITRAHDQMSSSANLITKDLAELKGMFASAMAGLRMGIK